MGKLERARKDPQPEAEKKARDLAFEIGNKVPKRVLNRALEHPPEIRNLIHPQDVSRHPVH